MRDKIWRFPQGILTMFGDLLRYFSFSVVAGSIWADIVPIAIALLYLQRISHQEQAMVEKYFAYFNYQESSRCLIPFIW